MKDDNFSNKSLLERAVLAGIYGPPELKREERRYYLGQFRERVIKVLTLEQIAEPGVYPEIQEAMAHPMARRVLISRRAVLSAAQKYVQLARKYHLEFTIVDSPEYSGPVGLVVAAGSSGRGEITVPSRRERLSGHSRRLLILLKDTVQALPGSGAEKAPEEENTPEILLTASGPLPM